MASEHGGWTLGAMPCPPRDRDPSRGRERSGIRPFAHRRRGRRGADDDGWLVARRDSTAARHCGPHHREPGSQHFRQARRALALRTLLPRGYRIRSWPERQFVKLDVIGAVEACYADVKNDEAWLSGLLGSLSPLEQGAGSYAQV